MSPFTAQLHLMCLKQCLCHIAKQLSPLFSAHLRHRQLPPCRLMTHVRNHGVANGQNDTVVLNASLYGEWRRSVLVGLRTSRRSTHRRSLRRPPKRLISQCSPSHDILDCALERRLQKTENRRFIMPKKFIFFSLQALKRCAILCPTSGKVD